MKKNIMYIIPSMNTGGVEIGMLEICKKNKETNDFNIFVLTSGGRLIDKLKQYGANVIILDVKSKNPIKIIRNIGKIKNIIKQNKIDLVQAESRVPAWSAYFACKKLKIPFITTVHGTYSVNSCLKKKYNSIMLKGDIVIAVSNFIKDYCLDNYKKYINDESKIKVLYRGIDENLFNQNNVKEQNMLSLQTKLNLSESDKRIIIALPARLTPIKGQDYFLEVLNLLKERNFICLLVGEPSKHKKYCDKLEKYIHDNKLNENIKICGNIDDIQTLYILSDIIISSTIVPESFGRISIEAQSMEKIFIGTALGGTLETVEDKVTGFLAPHNDKQKFAELLEYVINLSEEEKNKIRQNARKNVLEKFTFDSFYSELTSLYNKFLDI